MISSLKIGNAAGLVKSVEDVKRFAKIPLASYVTVGSITIDERKGNPTPREYDGGIAFFNSLGLPNSGINVYLHEIDTMRDVCRKNHKSLRVSIAAFAPLAFGALAQDVVKHIHALEVNFGCPNLWDNGDQKKIFSFSIDFMSRALEEVDLEIERVGARKRPTVSVKLSPYSDPGLLAEVAAFIGTKKHVSSVVLSNTFPNAYPLTGDGTQAISGMGYAGMSGPAMKSIVLGQVKQFRSLLPDRISITAVGGITSGIDVRDYLSVGASDVQVGTACWLGGEKVLQQIAQEYYALD